MKKIIMAFAAVVLLASCSTTGNVAFKEARNYFVNNTVDDNLSVIKITSDAELSKYLGMATTMGKDGQPTSIDFSKEIAIVVTVPTTDTETKIAPVSLQETGANALTLTYSVSRGGKMSYSVKPMFVIKAARKYAGYDIKAVEK